MPYRMVNGKIIVDVQVGGKVRPFLLDTGCSRTYISNKVNAGLNSQPTTTVLFAQDSGGQVFSAPVVRLDSLRCGNWVVTGRKVGVLDDNYPLLKCFGIDGIIGSDLLKKSVLHISSRDSVLILTSHVNRLPVRLGAPVMVSLREKRPYIQITGRNGNREASHWVLLDIGANGYSCSSGDFRSLEQEGVMEQQERGYGRSSYSVSGPEKPREQSRGILPELWIGQVRLEQVPVRTTGGPVSLLGTFLLEYGDITIDYRKKRFYYTVFTEDTRMKTERFPVSVLFDEGRMVIGVVWDETLKPIIREGDTVLSVNGNPTEQFNICGYFTGDFTLEPGMVFRVKTETGEMVEITL